MRDLDGAGMREDVVIVLNEREPLKRQMAGELSEQLGLRALAQLRIKPEGDLAALIALRRPKVLVLDYILGDVGTALDLLAKFREETSEQIKIIVWTDEPSVGAAVTALKLGAFDYIEMLPNRSLERVLKSIESAIESIPDQPRARSFVEKLSPLPPVGDSAAFKRCMNLIERNAQIGGSITFLSGPRGSGRNRAAEYLHACRADAGAFIPIDFDLFTGQLEQIVGSEDQRRLVPWLSNAATVFIDHVEFDNGELIEAVERRIEAWTRATAPAKLIIGSSSHEAAAAWSRLLDCTIIPIPPLAERSDDLLPLLTYFTGRLPGTPRIARAEFSPALIHQLAQLDWPGNVRELRAVAIESAAAPARDRGDSTTIAGLDRYSTALFQTMVDAKERWESFEQARPIQLNPFLVRRTLESTCGNLRVTAARLGTGIPQIRRMLEGFNGAAEEL